MVTDHQVLLFGSLLLCLFLHRIRRVKQDWKAVGNLPARSILVSPLDTLSRIIPRIPRISYGADFSWGNVYERQPLPRVRLFYPAHSTCLGVFAASKSDIIQLRSLFPSCMPQLLLADATATRYPPGLFISTRTSLDFTNQYERHR